MAKGPSTMKLTKEALEAMEWPYDVTEYTVHGTGGRVKRDLFGMFDILAISPCGLVGIQVTSGSNHSARRKKLESSEYLRDWLRCAKAEVWSWSKKGPRGGPKEWKLRTEEVGL